MMQYFDGYTVKDFANMLCEKDEAFKKLFTMNSDTDLLNESENERVERIFNEEKLTQTDYAQMSLCEFVMKWKDDYESSHPVGSSATTVTDRNDRDCNDFNFGRQPIYDYRHKTYRNPVVKPPISKGRPCEFNPREFVLECRRQNLGFPIDLKSAANDIFDELVMDEDSFHEELYIKESADHDLRYIAKVVAILNDRKSHYPILELRGETHLHIS